jgi:hypothetical protein
VLVPRDRDGQLLVDLGGELVRARPADGDRREEVGELVVQEPDVGHDHGGAPLTAACPRTDGLLELVGERAVLLLGQDPVPYHDQNGRAKVEIPAH